MVTIVQKDGEGDGPAKTVKESRISISREMGTASA